MSRPANNGTSTSARVETRIAAMVAAMMPFRFAQWVKRKAKMARNDSPRLWVWNNDMTRSGRATRGARAGP